jgi:hypothetical protein
MKVREQQKSGRDPNQFLRSGANSLRTAPVSCVLPAIRAPWRRCGPGLTGAPAVDLVDPTQKTGAMSVAARGGGFRPRNRFWHTHVTPRSYSRFYMFDILCWSKKV